MNRKITNVKPVFKIFKEGEKIPSCAENPKCNSELLVHEFLKISNKRLKELDSKQIHRENKTKITLYACFLSVSDIENIKQRFQAKVYIEAQWEDLICTLKMRLELLNKILNINWSRKMEKQM